MTNRVVAYFIPKRITTFVIVVGIKADKYENHVETVHIFQYGTA